MIPIFRISVVVSLLVYALFVAKAYFDSSFISQGMLDLLSWNKYEAVIMLPFWVDWITILIWLPVSIGTYYFYRPFRTIYLVLSVVFIFTKPLFGAAIFTGTDLMLFQLTVFLDGAILAMAYFTSVSERFN